MPFNSLLLTAFIPDGKWREHEVGVVISNELQNDVRYLLFLSDNDNFRKYLRSIKKKDTGEDVDVTESCCDLICIVQKGGVAIEERSTKRTDTSMIVCFIELKGGDKDARDKAAKQILNTYRGVKCGITEERSKSGEDLDKNITWKALIVTKGKIPLQKKDPLQDLKEVFNEDNEENVLEEVGASVDLTKILKL